MKIRPGVPATRPRRFPIAFALFATLLVSCSHPNNKGASEQIPGDIPENLRVNGPSIGVVHARGFQVYKCVADVNRKLSWTLKEPDAKFENAAGLTGTHYAGPTWRASDGSLVRGHKLQEQASPEPNAVPWLLLEAASHEGSGKLSSVTFIQRIHTSGGVAPAVGDAKAGDEVRVNYSADYVFYGPGATTQPANPR
jgi:hypothetical protein